LERRRAAAIVKATRREKRTTLRVERDVRSICESGWAGSSAAGDQIIEASKHDLEKVMVIEAQGQR
jgi:hypothetical protein